MGSPTQPTRAEAGSETIDSGPGGGFLMDDACVTEKSDGEDDIVSPNPVLEHPVTWDNMNAFSKEVGQVGSSYHHRIPSFRFATDPHRQRVPLFHLLPRPTRASFLQTCPTEFGGKASGISPSYTLADDARLSCRTRMQAPFPDATNEAERVVGSIVKSLVAVPPAQEARA